MLLLCFVRVVRVGVVYLLLLLLLLCVGTSSYAEGLEEVNYCSLPNATFECISGGCPSGCISSSYYCANITETANNVTNTDGLECVHYKLFLGDMGRDIGMIVVLFFCLALSSAGGIGGGGIIVPMLAVIAVFPPYYSIPLSSTAIVGGSIMQVFFQIRRRHPLPGAKHRRLPDFDTILLLLPMTLAGSVVGVLANSVSPDWLILTIVVLVLTFTTYKTARKGFQLKKKKLELMRASPTPSDTTSIHSTISDDTMLEDKEDSDKDSNEGDSNDHSHSQSHTSYDMTNVLEREMGQMGQKTANKNVRTEKEMVAALQKIHKREAAMPWVPIMITLVELVGVVVFSLLRGGKGQSLANVECGDGGYWGFQAATFVFLVLMTYVGFVYVKKNHTLKIAASYQFVDGDVNYIERGILKYLFAAFIAGLLAGFLGIGGGMVLAPLLLQIGMHPLVSSGTTAYMTLFAAAGSFTQFVILNRVPLYYGIALVVVAIFGSSLGQIVLHMYVKKTGNVYVIAFILAIIIGASAILLLVSGVLGLLEAYDNGESFGFKALC
eukprot:m.125074 g.125074  ORF g.125074 m.125074 type:complete len:551 (+) comp12974_c0_seq1:2383-4035(+)